MKNTLQYSRGFSVTKSAFNFPNFFSAFFTFHPFDVKPTQRLFKKQFEFPLKTCQSLIKIYTNSMHFLKRNMTEKPVENSCNNFKQSDCEMSDAFSNKTSKINFTARLKHTTKTAWCTIQGTLGHLIVQDN